MVRSRFPFLIPFERRNEGEGGEGEERRKAKAIIILPLLFSCFSPILWWINFLSNSHGKYLQPFRP